MINSKRKRIIIVMIKTLIKQSAALAKLTRKIISGNLWPIVASDLMKIRGYAIGEDSWGVRLKEEVKMTANEMPTVEEIVAKFPKISEFKIISLEGFEKNRKVADLDWVGDVDSCEADEMIAWEARNFNSFST
jgi:hypothetical protein